MVSPSASGAPSSRMLAETCLERCFSVFATSFGLSFRIFSHILSYKKEFSLIDDAFHVFCAKEGDVLYAQSSQFVLDFF